MKYILKYDNKIAEGIVQTLYFKNINTSTNEITVVQNKDEALQFPSPYEAVRFKSAYCSGFKIEEV